MLTILGNVLFLLGSMAFLDEAWETAGVWLFIAGSVCMVIDSYRQRQVLTALQQQLERVTFNHTNTFMSAVELPTTDPTSKPY